MRPALPLFATALATLLCLTAEAAPTRAKAKPGVTRDAARTFGGKPSRERGKLDTKGMRLPTSAERSSAVSGLDIAGTVAPVAWAVVTPRNPFEPGKAALVFSDPDAVDTRRSIAMWGYSGATLTLPSGEDVGDVLCELFGCPGTSSASARALQVWIDASASKKYSAVCRVKIEGKVGDMIVETDDATTTKHVDHTGKSSATVGFFLDPTEAGWYGFTIRSEKAWSTSGCTIDELQ